jgi:hypothetical protein
MIFFLGGSKPTPTETRQSRGAEGQIIGLTSDSPKGLGIGFPLSPAMRIRTYDHRPSEYARSVQQKLGFDRSARHCSFMLATRILLCEAF